MNGGMVLVIIFDAIKKTKNEGKKQERKWQERMVRSIVNSCLSSNAEKAKDRFCI